MSIGHKYTRCHRSGYRGQIGPKIWLYCSHPAGWILTTIWWSLPFGLHVHVPPTITPTGGGNHRLCWSTNFVPRENPPHPCPWFWSRGRNLILLQRDRLSPCGLKGGSQFNAPFALCKGALKFPGTLVWDVVFQYGISDRGTGIIWVKGRNLVLWEGVPAGTSRSFGSLIPKMMNTVPACGRKYGGYPCGAL